MLVGLLLAAGTAQVTVSPNTNIDRSPRDLAVTPDGRWALTANHTANSASLIDLADGKVVAEATCGQKPFAVAMSPDRTRAIVTNWWSGTVTLLDVAPPSLKVVTEIPVGAEPRGVAFSRDGKLAYVALGVASEIAVVDLDQRIVAERISVEREPWHLAASQDGRWLVVGCTGAASACIIDLSKKSAGRLAPRIVRSVPLSGANARQVAIDAESRWAYVTHTFERGFSTTTEFIGNGWVIAARLSRIPLPSPSPSPQGGEGSRGGGPKESLALDPQGRAHGDVEGVAVSADGAWIALAASGTHEVLIAKPSLPFVQYGATGDHMDRNLLFGDRVRTVTVGGRPLGMKFTPDSLRLLVANYLSNAVQVVDVETASLKSTIELGGPSEPSLARRGEAFFYDATLAHQRWFSCHTCHADGHTNHAKFDTLNDGRYGNPKKTLSLRNVTKTGPWTWHGVQEKVEDSIEKSVMSTLQGSQPTRDQLQTLVAFLATIEAPPNPYRKSDGTLTETAKRGELVFQSRRCSTCHTPPHFTSPRSYDVGTAEPDDAHKGYNPPSLINVHDRAPYLHDGRAKTLEELLRKFHQPERLTNTPALQEDELKDLVEYLKSL